MNKVLVTTTAVIAMFIFVQPGFAAQISVVPSNQTVSKGENFTVNISVDPEGSEVFGASYHLHFNNMVLNATDQTNGPFLSQDGADTNVAPNEISNTIGVIKYGEVRTGVTYGVTNHSILATITFKATESGTSSLKLSEVKLSGPFAQPIPYVLNGTCDVEIIEQTSTSGGEDDGNGGASVTPTKTPTPTLTPTPTPAQTPGLTPTPTPTITPVPSLSPSPSPTGVASPKVSPTPTPSSEGKRELPGFEAAFAIIGLLAVAYLISKRMEEKK